MAQKINRQVPRKHIGKKTTEAQEKIIQGILQNMQKTNKTPGIPTWAEAKHEYFENQEEHDLKEWEKERAPQIAKKVIATSREVADATLKEGQKEKKKRSSMTISEAKLGVTMVLDTDDCKKIGMDPDKTLTSEAIDIIRKKLGLPTRAERRKTK